MITLKLKAQLRKLKRKAQQRQDVTDLSYSLQKAIWWHKLKHDTNKLWVVDLKEHCHDSICIGIFQKLAYFKQNASSLNYLLTAQQSFVSNLITNKLGLVKCIGPLIKVPNNQYGLLLQAINISTARTSRRCH